MRFDETITATGRAGAGFREARRETPAPDAWRSSGVLLVLSVSAGMATFLGVGMICAGLGWSWTVALVADRAGRDAISIDLSAEYCAMQVERLRADGGMLVQIQDW